MIPFSRPLSAFGQVHTGTCHEVGHTWHPSCVYCCVEVFLFVYWGALKIYGPLYLVSDAVRGTPLRKVVKETLPHILRSCLFLAVNGGGFIGFLCLMRRLIGRFYHYLAAYPPAFFASVCAILVERKSRRGLLTGYVSSLAVETLYNMFKSRGYVTPIPYTEVALFSFASSVLLPAYKSEDGLHDAIGSVLSVLFNPRFPKPVSRLADRLVEGSVTPLRLAGYSAVNIGLLGAWCYFLGYATQVVIGLIGSGVETISNPKRLKHVLLNSYNARFGLFLATHVAGFKLLETALRALPLTRSTRLLVAGLLAGVSMVTVRSVPLALYAATKALEVVYSKAVKRGWAPNCYYGDVLLYSFSTAVLFHAAFFEGHNVRRSYQLFLSGVTGGRITQLNWKEIDTFGTKASRWVTMETERREKRKRD